MEFTPPEVSKISSSNSCEKVNNASQSELLEEIKALRKEVASLRDQEVPIADREIILVNVLTFALHSAALLNRMMFVGIIKLSIRTLANVFSHVPFRETWRGRSSGDELFAL
ncbi:hypothetical protein AVEN_104132-1 [Araneus ventricosus]|uniref:Uncharacterized protein n=1 Tax=Araneus ventricosus TaxID=182803 RepID=A0A4Y2W5F7_ARAVE|nr:hypothetical protein AVEN_104132-1 [Araneus ventricosus]